MLIKRCEELTKYKSIGFIKSVQTGASREETSRGAFPSSAVLSFTVTCPREFGVISADLVLWRDGENEHKYRLSPKDGEVYTLSRDLSRDGEGLFYYRIELNRGNDTLYSDTDDNSTVTFSGKKGTPLRLLVYEDDYKTPAWFPGGIMYHIFVDRFRKSGKASVREDAVNENDWNAPISQYGERPGDFVKNDLFFGGDLYGVAEKLPYLSSLGVTVIYLSPVFSARSNHKYDTCDYTRVDEAFGGDEALAHLISECRKHNIKIILDGVFNHTGDESIYFDKCRKYGNGAWENPDSPYRDWYFFDKNGEYRSWWGIEILPKLNHENDNCRKYFTAPGGIASRYVEKGAGGWRLDVADELSDKFLDEFRASVKSADPDALIIGEVWENAADKVAYGHRRRYLRGKQLDSVMNYPFRTALLSFLTSGDGAELKRELTEIYSSYPPCVADSLMNIIGTHDTERILTVLGDRKYKELSNRELSCRGMSREEYEHGRKLLKIASVIQYTVYGVPSVFYGDEAGLQGGRDPFCRRPYPWGREDEVLLAHYRKLGEIRKLPVFRDGEFSVISAGDGYIVFERHDMNTKIVVAANVGDVPMPLDIKGRELLSGREFDGTVESLSAAVIKC